MSSRQVFFKSTTQSEKRAFKKSFPWQYKQYYRKDFKTLAYATHASLHPGQNDTKRSFWIESFAWLQLKHCSTLTPRQEKILAYIYHNKTAKLVSYLQGKQPNWCLAPEREAIEERHYLIAEDFLFLDSAGNCSFDYYSYSSAHQTLLNALFQALMHKFGDAAALSSVQGLKAQEFLPHALQGLSKLPVKCMLILLCNQPEQLINGWDCDTTDIPLALYTAARFNYETLFFYILSSVNKSQWLTHLETFVLQHPAVTFNSRFAKRLFTLIQGLYPNNTNPPNKLLLSHWAAILNQQAYLEKQLSDGYLLPTALSQTIPALTNDNKRLITTPIDYLASYGLPSFGKFYRLGVIMPREQIFSILYIAITLQHNDLLELVLRKNYKILINLHTQFRAKHSFYEKNNLDLFSPFEKCYKYALEHLNLIALQILLSLNAPVHHNLIDYVPSANITAADFMLGYLVKHFEKKFLSKLTTKSNDENLCNAVIDFVNKHDVSQDFINKIIDLNVPAINDKLEYCDPEPDIYTKYK